jgi:hypothetical protein
MESTLKQSIQNLNVSREFKAMAHANDFETLEDLFEVPFALIHSLPLSGYRIVKEILVLLENDGLMNLVEE